MPRAPTRLHGALRTDWHERTHAQQSRARTHTHTHTPPPPPPQQQQQQQQQQQLRARPRARPRTRAPSLHSARPRNDSLILTWHRITITIGAGAGAGERPAGPPARRRNEAGGVRLTTWTNARGAAGASESKQQLLLFEASQANVLIGLEARRRGKWTGENEGARTEGPCL